MAQKRLKIKLASVNRKHSDLRKLRQKHWKKTNEDWYDHHIIRRDINGNKYILFTTSSALEKTKFQTAQLSVQLEDQISNVHKKLNLEHWKSQEFSIGRKLQKIQKKIQKLSLRKRKLLRNDYGFWVIWKVREKNFEVSRYQWSEGERNLII